MYPTCIGYESFVHVRLTHPMPLSNSNATCGRLLRDRLGKKKSCFRINKKKATTTKMATKVALFTLNPVKFFRESREWKVQRLFPFQSLNWHLFFSCYAGGAIVCSNKYVWNSHKNKLWLYDRAYKLSENFSWKLCTNMEAVHKEKPEYKKVREKHIQFAKIANRDLFLFVT